ncbi:MAG: kinase [Actinomycetota bacterium]|jgi:NAD+ kinase|nr:kinase [Actinomycetota bacterium]
MDIKKIALVVHPGKPKAVELKDELTTYFEQRGVTVDDDADLVVSLGGDGTMLRAARLAHSLDAPLLGVNLGMLGYLSEVDPSRARDALDQIFGGDYEIEERMMLSCRTSDDGKEQPFVGLNEALVERTGTHRLVRLGVKIGGESLAAFNADGVIVATPTGSTAYALSAGGPIVSPRAQCLILVPVSAHMIFSRPFVLSAEEIIEITVEGEQAASLSMDGQPGIPVTAGMPVLVQRADKPLRLVRLGGPGFVERLRVKLDLPV